MIGFWRIIALLLRALWPLHLFVGCLLLSILIVGGLGKGLTALGLVCFCYAYFSLATFLDQRRYAEGIEGEKTGVALGFMQRLIRSERVRLRLDDP